MPRRGAPQLRPGTWWERRKKRIPDRGRDEAQGSQPAASEEALSTVETPGLAVLGSANTRARIKIWQSHPTPPVLCSSAPHTGSLLKGLPVPLTSNTPPTIPGKCGDPDKCGRRDSSVSLT
uniref:Uncharacterized protein n=1 Tax=Molossus molossus TaxID=27622 RepID=A0A7J8I9Y8_MOLMO|nr:hypothetical protein HJG59_010683 [Molossus molossus]